jgi:hypothetical protein
MWRMLILNILTFLQVVSNPEFRIGWCSVHRALVVGGGWRGCLSGERDEAWGQSRRASGKRSAIKAGWRRAAGSPEGEHQVRTLPEGMRSTEAISGSVCPFYRFFCVSFAKTYVPVFQ